MCERTTGDRLLSLSKYLLSMVFRVNAMLCSTNLVNEISMRVILNVPVGRVWPAWRRFPTPARPNLEIL